MPAVWHWNCLDDSFLMVYILNLDWGKIEMSDKEKLSVFVNNELAKMRKEHIKTMPHGLCTKCYCTGHGNHNYLHLRTGNSYSFLCHTCRTEISKYDMLVKINGMRG